MLLEIYKLTFSELLHHKKGDKITYANNTNLYDTRGDHIGVCSVCCIYKKTNDEFNL